MADLAAAINALPAGEARDALARCCGSRRWVEGMLARRPFSSADDLFAAADAIWTGLEDADFLEAFSHHPAIGATAGRGFSASEQAQVAHAAAATLQELETLNRRYREHFGFVFLVCATGKSAGEMLALLRARIDNPAGVYIII
jgi:2-oxo-4-hydroxy-4-carboxy-5-ureidoimidazoline decarboxylase